MLTLHDLQPLAESRQVELRPLQSAGAAPVLGLEQPLLSALTNLVDNALRYTPSGGRVTYLATSQTYDEEMVQRVRAHQTSRPATWTTVECPIEVAAAVRAARDAIDLQLGKYLHRTLAEPLLRLGVGQDAPLPFTIRVHVVPGLLEVIPDGICQRMTR